MHRGGAGPRVPRAPARWRRAGPDADDATRRRVGRGARRRPDAAVPLLRVTANAHRIHYDHPYATEVEGYPDLVVHGPLTAILLAELARTPPRPGRARRSRTAPAPRTSPTAASGSPAHRLTTAHRLRAVRADGETAMTLEVR